MTGNPYAAPNVTSEKEEVVVAIPGHTSISFRLLDVSKTWVTRTFRFEGDFTGAITYDPRAFGFESIFVNSEQTVVSNPNPFSLDLVTPTADFVVNCKGVSIPARIEVKCSYLRLWKIRFFRLTINGQLVYSEP